MDWKKFTSNIFFFFKTTLLFWLCPKTIPTNCLYNNKGFLKYFEKVYLCAFVFLFDSLAAPRSSINVHSSLAYNVYTLIYLLLFFFSIYLPPKKLVHDYRTELQFIKNYWGSYTYFPYREGQRFTFIKL